MLSRRTLVLAALCATAGRARAQVRPSVADSSHFRPLQLAGPNEYRSGSGRPGPKYWQQRVDYRISATLDPAKNEVRGSETIHYVNHSPDSLPYLWLFVEQNICEPNSVTNVLNQPPLVFLGSSFDFSCQGFNSAPRMESLTIAGRDAKRTRFGTTMRVDLDAPLAPGASIDLDVGVALQRAAAGRRAHGARRAAVRDRAVVSAHGRLRRREGLEPRAVHRRRRVLSRVRQLRRHADRATRLHRRGDGRAGESGAGADRRRSGSVSRWRGSRTRRSRSSARARPETRADATGDAAGAKPATFAWHYTAKNVRDFAFAAGPEFRWDASGYNGILIETLYRPKADKWPEVNRMGREAIKYFSEQWYRVSLLARDDDRGADRGDGVSDAHLHAEQPVARGPAVGDRARVRPRMVPDGRRLERAALSVDGRRLQHLHRSRQRREVSSPARRTATRSRCTRCISTPSTRSRVTNSR